MRGAFLDHPPRAGPAAEIDGAGPWRTFFMVMLLLRRERCRRGGDDGLLPLAGRIPAGGDVRDTGSKKRPFPRRSPRRREAWSWSWPSNSIAAALVASLIPAFVLFGLLVQRRYFDGLLQGSQPAFAGRFRTDQILLGVETLDRCRSLSRARGRGSPISRFLTSPPPAGTSFVRKCSLPKAGPLSPPLIILNEGRSSRRRRGQKP